MHKIIVIQDPADFFPATHNLSVLLKSILKIRMKVLSVVLSLCLGFVILPRGCWASSILHEIKKLKETSKDVDVKKVMDVATKIRDIVPAYAAEDTVKLAQLIEEIRDNADTKAILEKTAKEKIVSEEGEHETVAESFGNASQEEIVKGMIQIYDSLKSLDFLFEAPENAEEVLEAVIGEGVVDDEEKIKLYRENPGKLEEDMRDGYFSTFVYVASKAGFL